MVNAYGGGGFQNTCACCFHRQGKDGAEFWWDGCGGGASEEGGKKFCADDRLVRIYPTLRAEGTTIGAGRIPEIRQRRPGGEWQAMEKRQEMPMTHLATRS